MMETIPWLIRNIPTGMREEKKKQTNHFNERYPQFSLRQRNEFPDEFRDEEFPAKVHVDLISSVSPDMKRQAVEAPLNIKQIRNAQKIARRADLISKFSVD